MQRAVADQHRSHVAAALVQAGLDDGARSLAVGVGLEVEHLGLEEHLLQQLAHADTLLRADVLTLVLAAPLLDEEVHGSQAFLNLVGVGSRFIYLVDGKDDGHAGSRGMRNGLLRLRHDVVVCGNDDDGNVRHLGTAGTHGGESLVARRVEEGDVPSVVERHIVGTDVLRDAARLTRDDVGLADVVEQRRLAMVDVAHDGDDGSAGHEVGLIVLLLADCGADLRTDVFCGEAELLGNEVDGLGIHALIDADHDADAHACGDNLRDGHVHHRGELIGRDELRQLEHLALCCLVCQLFLHSLPDGFALLATVLGALAHLARLIGKAGQGLAYLLCHFLVAYFGLDGCLLGAVLLLLALAAALLVLGLARAAVLLLSASVLRLVGYGIDVDALFADADALLAVAALSVLSHAFAATFLVRLLLGPRVLVQAAQVYLALDGQARSNTCGGREAEHFIFFLLFGSRRCRCLLLLFCLLFFYGCRSGLCLRSRCRSGLWLLLLDGSRGGALCLYRSCRSRLRLRGLCRRLCLRGLCRGLCLRDWCRLWCLHLLFHGLRRGLLLLYFRFRLCHGSLGCLGSLGACAAQVDAAQYLGSGHLRCFHLHLFHHLGLGRFLAFLGLVDVLLDELRSLLAQSLVGTERALQQRILLFGNFVVGIGLNLAEAFLLEIFNSRLQSDVELLGYFV